MQNILGSQAARPHASDAWAYGHACPARSRYLSSQCTSLTVYAQHLHAGSNTDTNTDFPAVVCFLSLGQDRLTISNQILSAFSIKASMRGSRSRPYPFHARTSPGWLNASSLVIDTCPPFTPGSDTCQRRPSWSAHASRQARSAPLWSCT